MYKNRSRRSETPSSSSSGNSYLGSPYSHATAYSPDSLHSSYSSMNPTHYGYSSADSPPDRRLSYEQYSSPSPPQFEDPTSSYSHRISNVSRARGVAARHVGPESTAERASKRQRSATSHAPSQGHAQWVGMPPDGCHYAVDDTRNVVVRSQSTDHVYAVPYGHPSLRSPSSISDSPTVNPYGARHSRSPSSDDEFVEHGPTELPPRSIGGKSHFDRPKKPGKIPGSAMDYLPILEARFDRLETAIDKYVDLRGQQALANSILPGSKETSFGLESASHRGHARR